MVYPSGVNCLICNVEEDKEFLCISCMKKIKYLEQGFYTNGHKCFSVVYYNDVMKKLVSDFKYKKDFNIGEFFSEILYKKIRVEKIEFDYITFVPMNKSALKKRGFNQCKYLAENISEKTNKKILEIVGKREGVKEQKTLSRSERRENIKDAFYVRNKNLNINNKKVLIIDDVITSGETLYSFTKTIKSYYNIDVFLLTVVKSSI